MIKALSSKTPQMLHTLRAACRWRSGGLPVVLIAGVMLGIVAPAAQATHFRFGHIHAGPGAQPNEVKFVVQTVWRLGPQSSSCIDPATGFSTPCSGPGGQAAIGDIVSNSPGGLGNFAFGDGSTAPPRYLVTSISPVPPGGDNWYFGVLVDTAEFPNVVPTVSHTYAGPGPRTAQISGCCRISSSTAPNRHINNPDGSYAVRATIDVGTGNSTPVALIPPIVLCPIDDVCTIPIQAVDPDGDNLRFRFSTPGEAGGGFTQPGPPHAPNAATIDPDTGVLTWDTTGANLGGVDPIDWNVLYSTHVTIEDLDGDDNVKSSVALDFFIRLVPAVGPAPQFNEPDPFDPLVIHAMVGDTVNFNVSVKPGEEPEPECGDPGTGDCCEAQVFPNPYCDDEDCCLLICAQDPYCCDTSWDSLCADAANDQCAICTIEASDICEDAQLLTCGAEVIGSTVDATFSMAGTCGTSHTAPEVWYRLVGTGDEITVDTCHEDSDYDTKLTVWTGDCDNLECVGGNDDAACDHGGLLSRVTFTSVAGQNYFIMVHGFSANIGTFGLNVDCSIPTANTRPLQRPFVHGGGVGDHELDTKTDKQGGTHLPDGVGDISDRLRSVPLGGGGPDPDELTLNVVGLPPGATMNPELPITEIGGITSKFTWIPQPQHVGTHIVIYTATSSFGQSVLLPVTIIVEELEVLCGDLNFDDVVDNEDLVLFMDAYGSCDGDPHYNPLADYTDSGCIGMADLAIWYDCYLCFLDPNCPEEE